MVHVDFGTGDGTFVRRTAKVQPDALFIGVGAIADNLHRTSRRAEPNVLFGRLALDDAPGELAGLADGLTVLFPWGSLLSAVALAQPAPLARLRAMCKPGAEVRFVFEFASDPRALEALYEQAGFALCGQPLSVAEARAAPTTWAKKLGFSRKPRSFWEFKGPVPEHAGGRPPDPARSRCPPKAG